MSTCFSNCQMRVSWRESYTLEGEFRLDVSTSLTWRWMIGGEKRLHRFLLWPRQCRPQSAGSIRPTMPQSRNQKEPETRFGEISQIHIIYLLIIAISMQHGPILLPVCFNSLQSGTEGYIACRAVWRVAHVTWNNQIPPRRVSSISGPCYCPGSLALGRSACAIENKLSGMASDIGEVVPHDQRGRSFRLDHGHAGIVLGDTSMRPTLTHSIISPWYR